MPKTVIVLTLLIGTIIAPEINAQCNIKLNSTTGVFHSPNYPQKYNVGTCSYTIQVPVGYHIVLNWQSFNVGAHKKNDHCPNDFVTIFNHNQNAHQGKIEMCGNHGQSITSSGNTLVVVFSGYTNGMYQGFLAKYTAKKIMCNGMVVSTDVGMIGGPRTPPYDCLHTIRLPLNRKMTIDLLHHNVALQTANQTCNSSITLYTINYTPKNMIYRFCFNLLFPPVFDSTAHVAYIRFTSIKHHHPFNGITIQYRSTLVPKPTSKPKPTASDAPKIVFIVGAVLVSISAIVCSGLEGRKRYKRKAYKAEDQSTSLLHE